MKKIALLIPFCVVVNVGICQSTGLQNHNVEINGPVSTIAQKIGVSISVSGCTVRIVYPDDRFPTDYWFNAWKVTDVQKPIHDVISISADSDTSFTLVYPMWTRHYYAHRVTAEKDGKEVQLLPPR